MPERTPEQIALRAKLVEHATGTAQTIVEIAQAFEIDENLCGELISETEIEICDMCGWWCESSEMNEDSYCEDCAASNED